MAINLALIADLHYVGVAEHRCPIEKRRAGLALWHMQSALETLCAEVSLDAIALMGDLVDNGKAPSVEKDMQAVRETVGGFDVPVVVLRGNHDPPAAMVRRCFPGCGDALSVKGYRLVPVWDTYDEQDRTVRAAEDLARVHKEAADLPDTPIVVLQHAVVTPPIASDYPYNYVNAPEIVRAYERANVLLSVSGHYHRGVELAFVGGVGYLTVPALCESPHRFLHVRIEDRNIAVRTLALEGE